ncbi:hypothetical protein [Arthrobacter sp. SX1312]|uniref:hypothetical protein n=1 Tax=Arthrobacter sp. SX1312 TaxID=2058896 RepID=UPI0011B0C1BC|nr:hypothetical protein [Arthrobacter sp. SX1312]
MIRTDWPLGRDDSIGSGSTFDRCGFEAVTPVMPTYGRLNRWWRRIEAETVVMLAMGGLLWNHIEVPRETLSG